MLLYFISFSFISCFFCSDLVLPFKANSEVLVLTNFVLISSNFMRIFSFDFSASRIFSLLSSTSSCSCLLQIIVYIIHYDFYFVVSTSLFLESHSAFVQFLFCIVQHCLTCFTFYFAVFCYIFHSCFQILYVFTFIFYFFPQDFQVDISTRRCLRFFSIFNWFWFFVLFSSCTFFKFAL